MSKYKLPRELRKKYNLIKRRCYNSNTLHYHRYGGRGIRMCNEWLSNIESFILYIMALENYGLDGMTLDRIDNDGDYEPGNLRWADMHVQTANRSKQTRNKSGYIGVQLHHKKYRFEITIRGKRIKRSGFETPEDAVKARNNYIIHNNLTEYPLQNI